MPLPLPLSFWFKSPSSLIRTMAIAFLLMSLSPSAPDPIYGRQSNIIKKQINSATPLLKTLYRFSFFRENAKVTTLTQMASHDLTSDRHGGLISCYSPIMHSGTRHTGVCALLGTHKQSRSWLLLLVLPRMLFTQMSSWLMLSPASGVTRMPPSQQIMLPYHISKCSHLHSWHSLACFIYL